MNNKHFIQEDIDFIKDNYLEMSDLDLSDILDRTEKSIAIKRQRLGLFRFECEKVNTIKGEEWKPVKGFEDKYWVSNKGRIKSVKGLLKTYLNEKGYAHFFASFSKTKHKTYKVHRAVAEAFIPNPFNKLEVNHIDLNKLNNELHNLEWVTRQENMDHWSLNSK